uniref:ABC transporter G family member 20 n=2 Tax=Cacopsylla melanoneura TaxID=428564 RepID=A0A8D8TE71_9HEMI
MFVKFTAGEPVTGKFAVYNEDIENKTGRSDNVDLSNAHHVNKRWTPGAKFRQSTLQHFRKNRAFKENNDSQIINENNGFNEDRNDNNDLSESIIESIGGIASVIDENASNDPVVKYYLTRPKITSKKTCNDYNGDQGPLSCVFLSTLKAKHPTLSFDYYQSFTLLRKKVLETGKYLGYFIIPENYTRVIVEKFNESKIQPVHPVQPVWVSLDMTNRETGLELEVALSDFQEVIWIKYGKLQTAEVDPRYYRLPISISYEGEKPTRKVDFVAPGVMLVMTFFLHSGLTSSVIILERNSGLWERNSVLGVTDYEIVLSFLLVMSFFAFLNSLIVVGTVYFLYSVPCEGSLVLVFVLVFLQSMNGEVFGFLCSVIAKSITQVNFINLGFYYPFIHLSGVVTSIDSMSPGIRYIGYLFPLTLAIKAVRKIQSKGYGLFHLVVVAGFVSTLVWTVILSCMILGILAYRRVRMRK